jgi:hypothetical protein
MEGHRTLAVSLRYSLDTHDDVWELANTAIEPTAVNRLPVSARQKLVFWVKTGSGGSQLRQRVPPPSQ